MSNPIDRGPLWVSRRSSIEAADQFPVENPVTGAVIAVVQGGGVVEIDAAVHAADQACAHDWRWRIQQERGTYLLRCAAVLEQHTDEVAVLEFLRYDKPTSRTRMFDIPAAVGLFRYFGALIDKVPGELHDAGSILSSVIPEPHGVVGTIIPFDWPPIHTAGKIGPALAVGSTVVEKPGEHAPLTVMRMVALLQSVLPADVVQVVPGHGPIAAQAVVAHPLAHKISFTGSTRAGRAAPKSTADNITPALLEHGGKNALLVFDDAGLERAVRDALERTYFNQGEACTASSRFLVQRAVYEEFVRRLGIGVSRPRVGDGADGAPHVGSLVARVRQRAVLEYLRVGRRRGVQQRLQPELRRDCTLRRGRAVRLWTGPLCRHVAAIRTSRGDSLSFRTLCSPQLGGSQRGRCQHRRCWLECRSMRHRRAVVTP